MRIGVVSDTHGNAECLRRALGQMGEIDLLIHAGDHYRDAISMGKEKDIKTVAVTGNCDWSVPGADEVELEIMGYRIFVTHGHKYSAKSGNDRLIQKLKEGKYNLLIYGHSHIPEITHMPEGILFNPGSAAVPRMGSKRSYGIIDIGKNGIVPYIYELIWQS